VVEVAVEPMQQVDQELQIKVMLVVSRGQATLLAQAQAVAVAVQVQLVQKEQQQTLAEQAVLVSHRLLQAQALVVLVEAGLVVFLAVVVHLTEVGLALLAPQLVRLELQTQEAVVAAEVTETAAQAAPASSSSKSQIPTAHSFRLA
jgi:hypothetical protein